MALESITKTLYKAFARLLVHDDDDDDDENGIQRYKMSVD